MIEAGVLEGCDSESDTSRLGALFDAHHARLYRLARRLAGSREEALDLVQETFLRAVRRVSGVPGGEQAEEAWLVRVLINVARDGWRRAKVREIAQQDVPGGSVGNPEDAYVVRLSVQRALAKLPPRRRAIVVLSELEGKETAAIARLLGIAAVTVRWHLSRGRAELADALEEIRAKS
jgi:RNA polymerase sigma-70 factor (ECF subfamily)